jgi:Tol biopolymer transport system component
MNIDGSSETQITNFTNAGGVYTGNASWFPNTSKVVFITGKDTDGGSGIYTMNSDGTNITRINHNARDEENPTWK